MEIKFDDAKFNLGYELVHTFTINGESFSEDDTREHLFTEWQSTFHRVSGRDGTITIPVECGDLVKLKMGNVGRFEVQVEYEISGYRSTPFWSLQ